MASQHPQKRTTGKPSGDQNVGILWFHDHDLRCADNPALAAAFATGVQLIAVYIHSEDPDPWAPGAASRWWLHHSLAALAQKLQRYHLPLILRTGMAAAAMKRLIDESQASAVFWNESFLPDVRRRDQKLAIELEARGIVCHRHNASLLLNPQELRTQQGQPFKVFTPFWRALQKQLQVSAPLPEPAKSRFSPIQLPSESLNGLALLPRIHWDAGLAETWQPGEPGALAQLSKCLENIAAHYNDRRDYPAQTGTSRLSPHLRFGELSPRQVWWQIHAWQQREPHSLSQSDALLRQLAWREFAYYVLFHFPTTADEPMNERFAHFPWRSRYSNILRRWEQGQTGFPIIDAGMRELWHTGWMHNRVRMIVASFLTKNCRVPWQVGARWFWDTLVDADLANNSMGWQWVAGCGVDAAPYFRIFNPTTQSEKFDPEGAYIRRWVPELGSLTGKFIHAPHLASASVLADAGIKLGKDYPQQMVDLATTRQEALAAYQKLRSVA